jgi:hypothetical protein
MTEGDREGTLQRRVIFVFRTLLWVQLAIMAGFFAMLVGVNWGHGNDGRLTLCFAASYLIATVMMLVGVSMGGDGGVRGIARRLLVLMPCGMVVGTLLVGDVLALDELMARGWYSGVLSFEGVFALPLLGGAVLGAVLTAVTRRVSSATLFFRSWLYLLIFAVLVVAQTVLSALSCSLRPAIISGFEAGVGALAALAALSWTFGFGLALGASRKALAEPEAGSDDSEEPLRPRSAR